MRMARGRARGNGYALNSLGLGGPPNENVIGKAFADALGFYYQAAGRIIRQQRLSPRADTTTRTSAVKANG